MLFRVTMLVYLLTVRLDQANPILLSVMARTKELYQERAKRYSDVFNYKKKRQTTE